MNNIQNIFGQLSGALQNPMQFLISRGFPQGVLNNPQQAVQELLNSGRMTQQQFNQLQETAKQIQSMPQFRNYFQNR